MNRRLRAFIIVIVIAVLVVLALWEARTARPGSSTNLQGALHSTVANAEAAVKRRLTGGIGALLRIDPAFNLPEVDGVRPGSPAEGAGLRQGDFIVKVGDWPTAGQPLADVVKAIHGFALGSVTITIQRSGSTNLTLEMRRNSWTALGVTNMYSAPTSLPAIFAATTNMSLVATNNLKLPVR